MPIEPTLRNAAHLLRRAGWGGTLEEIRAAADRGIDATVEALLDPADAPLLVEPARSPGVSPYDLETLQLWFVRHAATSPTPLLERLCWFWHGHFATSIEKVELGDLMFRQLATLRANGAGRFDDLLLSVVHDPAMNTYLDLGRSVVGQPNENFARELMELFTLGVGNGYTQADVVEVGRAFTGYLLDWDAELDRPTGTRLVPALHDHGEKRILGRVGPLDGHDVVELLAARPECHRFIARRFWLRHAGTDPVEAVLDDLAAAFADRLVIADLARATFTHPAFYADDVHQALVAQPVEVVVRTVRGFELPLPDPAAGSIWELDDEVVSFGPIEWLETLGQRIGLPPNVGGWPHNGPWLDTNRAAGRLLAGTSIGDAIIDHSPHAEALLDLVGRPAAITEALMVRFGVVEWSLATEEAIGAALRTGEPDLDLRAAIALAFTSPEVTLS